MLLSIIIVAYNNEDYIEQAIASCACFDDPDCEVLVVHNRSTDRTGEVVRDLMDGRGWPLRLISNDENEGPGEARNIGMRQASGDYFMFLDGDDWFEPGAIRRVMDRLRQWRPDLLMFNHQRALADGRRIPNIPNRYVDLRGEPADLTDPAVRKGAIRNLHISWNKAYGRRFVEKHGLEFPRLVYHEDLLWSIKAMVCAGSFHFMPDIVYNYRQHPQSSINTRNEGHFAVIHECRRLKDFLGEHDDYRRWYGMQLYGYAQSALYGVINTRYRIPEPREEAYLREMVVLLREFRSLLGIWKPDLLFYAAMTGRRDAYFRAAAWAARMKRMGKIAFDFKMKFVRP